MTRESLLKIKIFPGVNSKKRIFQMHWKSLSINRQNKFIKEYTYWFLVSQWYIYIYIYIYILAKLLSTSIHGDKEKKKKTLPEFRDDKSQITAWGKKKENKKLSGGKKRKGQLRHTSWKKSRDMQSVGQKNKNPPQNAAMLRLQKVLNTK